MAAIATLKDRFDDNSLNTALWTEYEGGSATVTEQNGRLEIAYPASSTSSTDGDIISASTYDFTASVATLRVIQMPSSATNANAELRIYTDSNNWFRWVYEAGTLYAQRRKAGSSGTITSFTYSQSSHRYLKIEEHTGVVTWSTSADGITWTAQGTYTHGMTITAMRVMIAGTCYQNESNPGTFIAADFNHTARPHQRRFTYKIYDTDGVYKGNLPNVISEFKVTEQINEAGAPLNITIAASLEDLGAGVVSDPIVDSDGDPIEDSGGEPIYASYDYVFNDIPIEIRYGIDVYVYDEYYPNGKRIYSGFVYSFSAGVTSGTVDIEVVPWAIDLDEYMAQTPPNSIVASQLTENDDQVLYSAFISAGSSNVTNVAQTFQVGSDVEINTISVRLRLGSLIGAAPPASASPLLVGTVNVTIFAGGTPALGGTVLGSTYAYISNTTDEDVLLTFTSPVQLTSATSYYFNLGFFSAYYEQIYLRTNSAGGYASGQTYTYTPASGIFTGTGEDLYFAVYSFNGAVGITYSSSDPGFIARNTLSTFQALGGNVNYDDSSIALSNTTVTYAFKFNTLLEVIRKCLELAPANWYWMVNLGENKLYFKRRQSAPNHYLWLGVHITDLTITRTMDKLVNTVYFSGGDIGGGINLMTLRTNSTSIERYGQRLAKLSDNRVTNEDTAAIMSNTALSGNHKPAFRTEVSVSAAVYDIESIQLGDMVTFRNCIDYVRGLKLMVVGVRRFSDEITLTLDTALPSVSHRIEDIKRNVEALQTINNPDSLT